MSAPTGSKRSATTPFASPSKAASKRSRTQYDYGEDDVESFPEDQWSDGDADSMILDDADDDVEGTAPRPFGEFSSASSEDEDGFEEFKDVKITGVSIDRTEPPPAASMNCRCGATNVKKKACVKCVCSKWGYRCKAETCGCHGGPSCHNPFNELDVLSIFGPEPVTLHECFISWVLRQKEVRPEQITTRTLFDQALRYSPRIKDVTMWCDPYLEWRAKWDALSEPEKNSEVELIQEMNRWAFTKQDRLNSMGVFFSFCALNDRWDNDDNTWHCRICGECVDWRTWHCRECNECSYGTSFPCDGCGGVVDGRVS